MPAAAAAVLFVMHSSNLHSNQLCTTIILSLIASPNTPQRRLFDFPKNTFQASFPSIDICPQESAEAQLCLEK